MRAWGIAVAALGVLLQGCASSSLTEGFKVTPTLDRSHKKYASDAAFEAAKVVSAASTPEAKATARNNFIDARLTAIDIAYDDFTANLQSERANMAVGMDVTTLVANGLGAAVPQNSVKTAMAAIAAALTGSRASIDKNVYYDRALSAILSQMDAARLKVRERILAGMASPIELYQFGAATGDLSAYYAAGTLASAINGLAEQAGKEKAAADEKLRSKLPSADDLRKKYEGAYIAEGGNTSQAKFFGLHCLKNKKVAPELRQAIDEYNVRNKVPKDVTALSTAYDEITTGKDDNARDKAFTDPLVAPQIKIHCDMDWVAFRDKNPSTDVASDSQPTPNKVTVKKPPAFKGPVAASAAAKPSSLIRVPTIAASSPPAATVQPVTPASGPMPPPVKTN